MITLTAQPAGQSPVVLKSARVDAHGNLVVFDKVTRNTTFTASYAGDFHYAPRTASHGVTVVPTVRTQTQYPLATTRFGSTVYQVFYTVEVNMGFNLKVTPTQPSACATATVQHLVSGVWRTMTTSGCVPRYTDGWYGYGRALRTFPANGRYRIAGHYAPPRTGAVTTGVWTPWTYFTVRAGQP